MTAPLAPTTQALATGYTAQQAATRATVVSYLNLMWSRLTSWRTPDAEAFARAVAPIISGAQQQTAASTAAYLGHLVQAGGGAPGAPELAAVDDATLRGVPAVEVYQRPFTQLWTDLARGKPLPEAVDSAGKRLQSLARTDLQLAKTHTSRQLLTGSTKVTGYRRVLTGDRSCALCVLAADRTYHKAELLPIHPGCDCAVAPLFGGQDAPDIWDMHPDLAADLHNLIADQLGAKYVSASGKAARGRFRKSDPLHKASGYSRVGAEDYRNIVVTHQHGELGPVLAVRGHDFTSAKDIHDAQLTDADKVIRARLLAEADRSARR